MIDFNPDAVAPPIDYSRIPFPTDALTIGQLRKRFPGDFDAPGGKVRFFHDSSRGGYGDQLTDIMNAERELAALVYDIVVGRNRDPEAVEDREELIDRLSDDFQFLRLAQGSHHGVELVRSLVSAAEAQARAWLGHKK